MKALRIPCNCGQMGCTTEVEVKEDSENVKNLLLVIRDDKHDVDIYASLDSSSVDQIVKAFHTKFKRKS